MTASPTPGAMSYFALFSRCESKDSHCRRPARSAMLKAQFVQNR